MVYTGRVLDQCSDPVTIAVAIAGEYRHELGYILRRSLERAANRGELYTLGTHAFAYIWHRRDGQTTLHAIAVERQMRVRHSGRTLLDRIVVDCRSRGQGSLLARCPEDLPSNDWYQHQGFILESTAPGKARHLNIWRLAL